MGVLRGLQGFLCSTLERTPATPHLAPGLKEVSPTHCLSSVMHLGSCWAPHSPSRIWSQNKNFVLCLQNIKVWARKPLLKAALPWLQNYTAWGFLPSTAGGRAPGRGFGKAGNAVLEQPFSVKTASIIEVFKNLRAIFQLCISWITYDRNTAMQVTFLEGVESSNLDWTHWLCIFLRMLRHEGDMLLLQFREGRACCKVD